MKKRIRLTESDLHRIVKESVKRVLRESAYPRRRFGLRESIEDEKQLLDDYMINIRSVRDELGLYMQGYCNIDGKTVIKVNQRGQGAIKHTSLGFSLDDNGDLVMHLIEDQTNSDIMEPVKVPSNVSDSADMYRFLEKGLETLWHYEGGFFFKGDDKDTQWELNNTMYDRMNDGMGRSNAEDILYSSPERNMNVEDDGGIESMYALDPNHRRHKYAINPKWLEQKRKDYKDRRYRKM